MRTTQTLLPQATFALVVVWAAVGTALAQPRLPQGPLSVEACVAIAVRDSGLVQESEGKVGEWRGRLAEVEALYYPKLVGMTYVAPMYRLTGGPFDKTQSDWTEWGPYLHLEAVLAQPLYTFGRVQAGKDAAQHRVLVEQARVRQTRNAVALETRKLYYLHLYARTLQPTLDSASKTLESALTTARQANEKGTGEVTTVDLQKLIYGAAELQRYRIQARIGADLSLAALKHTLGLPQEATLTLADESLPPLPTDLPGLPALLQSAASGRPEWTQIRHGKAAAVSLAQAERLANLPIVFAAGQVAADWTPMRQDVDNPYFQDRYNQIYGGLAVGLQFSVDPATASAKSVQALAIADQIDGLAAFAATGIPIEVRKASDEWQQAQEIGVQADLGAGAAKKWMAFAAAGFATGTVEAREVLEGLVAWLSARRTQIENTRDAHLARAQLLYALGQDLDHLGAP
jgi:outer membrane protein